MASFFYPDFSGMRRVHTDLHERLHLSLTHLLTEVIEPDPGQDARIREGLARLRAVFPEPALFALHMALRDSLLAEDIQGFSDLRRQFSSWNFRAAPDPGLAVRSLAADQLGGARVDLIARAIADDVGLTTALSAPPSDVARSISATIGDAALLLRNVAPDWSAELETLVSQVILAVNGREDGRQGFAGGSSFDLFGAILINPLYRRDLAHCLMTLIHESSHLRLFCWHLDDEIVLNAPEETFRSPLRKQPRPMEGVYHATWVSARMAVCGGTVLRGAGDMLSADDRASLGREVDRALATFHDGVRVVCEGARLTPLGTRLMDDARHAAEADALEGVGQP